MDLTIRHFGPIREAQMQFGDLTLLIGPQASEERKYLFPRL